jgi:ATP-binding cassette, subfamily B, bacterial PglK
MIANLFKNINFLCSKKQRKLLIIFSFLTFLSTLLEMIGLSLIPVSVSTLLKVEEYNSYLPEIFIVQEFFKKDQIEQFMFLSFGIILIFLIKNVFAFSIIYFEGKLFRDIRVDNANKLYDIYVNLPIIEHYSYNVATILKNIASESRYASEYIFSISAIIRELLLFAGIFILIVFFNPIIAISILLAGSLFAFLYLFVVKKKLLKETKNAEKIREYQIKNINQVFSSLKETRILNTTKFFIKEFFEKTSSHENSYFILHLLSRIPKYILETSVVSGIFILSIYLLKSGYEFGNLIPLLALVVVAAIRLLPSFNSVTLSLTNLKRYGVSVKIIMDEIDKFKNINKEDFENYNTNKNNLIRFKDTLQLENISFSFPNTKEELFKNCSIEIRKGEKIGIVGPSGSGKTTLLNIILGLLKPTSGKILADNNDIHANLKEWHLKIGFIPQEIYLLDDTIIKNVALGLANEKEDIRKVEQALKHAEIYEFTKNLKEGLNTKVGDRGIRFSGGQRQRVGIARALYRNPSVLIFDEATSALDEKTEKKFIENVFKLPDEKTIILSTHKIEILNKCDRIYKVENNRLEIFKSDN